MSKIFVCNANTHNLKKVSCSIPHGSMCCVTGISGSGKSSFAFDTLFIEGQRRYIQSLSHHAKRIIGSLPQPDVESISGLTPTLAIEQKTSAGSPRSTVGTLTEIYDHLRVLYAKMAIPHCPVSGEPLVAQTKSDIIYAIFEKYSGKKMVLLAPWGRELRGTLKEHLEKIEQKGFSRVYLDGTSFSISSLSHIDPSALHTLEVVIDRVEVSEGHRERLEESVSTALELGKGVCYLVDPETDERELFSESAYAKISGKFYPKLEPQDFSFNTPSGMCEECQGLGLTQEFILEKIIDPEKSVSQDFCSVAGSYKTVHYGNIYDNLAHIYSFSLETPWKKLSEQAQKVLLYGTEKKWTRMVFINPNTGSSWSEPVRWQGILHEARWKYSQAKSKRYKQKMEEVMVTGICPSCRASRLKPYPSAARFHGFSLSELAAKTIDDLLSFISSLTSLDLTEEIIRHIRTKLEFLHKVGAGYLSLDRGTLTLSGGEFQRVKLASHLGSGLTGVTYVLDEPSIGLHQHDTHKLIDALFSLKKGGNTLLVVEHDPSIMRASDWIIDFGPGAGVDGGKLIYEGSLSKFRNAKNSLTADYLYGKKKIERMFPDKKPGDAWLKLKGTTLHNLKKDMLSIPLGLFVAITGVSGSGKSSLLLDTLYPVLSNKLMRTTMTPGPYTSLSGVEHLDKVIHIDQSPIGRTPRSNPATYSGVFDDIRFLFASLPESKARGWNAGRFSFNVKEGSCPVCTGMGLVQVNVDFLEETWVECQECKGKRFDNETLSIKYKDKSIHDVLSMTCKEALSHFSAIPPIKKGLEILCRVGLDYLQLGQSSTTLSGGEAQRLKIAKELARPATGKTLYLLDEPTTGLHFHDLSRLLNVLHELVDRKNTVLVIEHNMDLVRTADWIIDLGPGAGVDGGHIIAQGTPQELAQLDTPTGKALRSATKEVKAYTARPSKELPTITLRGARQHNLKNLNLSLPKNKLIALIGPSGSGKASLAFDTLFAEGQRTYVESLSPYARQFIKQMPKPLFGTLSGIVPAVAIEQRRHASNPRSTVGTLTEVYDYLRIIYACHGTAHCPTTGAPIRTISKERVADILLAQGEPRRIQLFAPLAPLKSTALFPQIEYLKKLGYTRLRIDGEMVDTNTEKPPQIPAGRLVKIDVLVDRLTPSPEERSRLIQSIGEACRLSQDKVLVLREGKERLFNLAFAVEDTGESFPEITPLTFSFSSPFGMCEECAGLGVQVESLDEEDEVPESATPCPVCHGTRLNALARAVSLCDKSLPEICTFPMSDLASWLSTVSKTLRLEKSIAHAFRECEERLTLADEIGIGYISLDRGADTLSMGEAERVYLLSQIGSRLAELLYVIDTPSAGLHPDDIARLFKVLNRIKALGNTLILIENNKQCIQKADHIIELGNGELVFEGELKEFLYRKKSFFKKRPLTPPQKFLSSFSFSNIACHNLKNICLDLPVNAIVAIVGVSGAGKSTLLFDVIEKSMLAHINKEPLPYSSEGLEQFSRIVSFDQKPHGTTSRSDLYSYLDLSTSLREFYASLPQARELGLTPAHFSTSNRSGMCPKCWGMGYKRIDMYFLPPVEVPCDLCNGLRFKDKTLSVEYAGVNIGKFLTLPLKEARALFKEPSKITRSLDALIELGLHYLSLGQEMATLSFNEVQRVKFAKELAHRRRKGTLYLFDEPTIGLDAGEVETLVQKLYHLKQEGHTLLLIEHNLDVISLCDHVVELGPEAGVRGGYIVAEGSPSTLPKNAHSRMGQLLKSKDNT